VSNPSSPEHRHTSDAAAPRIRIEPCLRTARAIFNGETLAKSDAALVLHEQGYEPRIYFPMHDVRMDLLTTTDRSTHCPFKGDASYWTIVTDGEQAPDAAWAYRHPVDDVVPIKDHLSFAEPIQTDA
jgi:uncharacterized protein (DUF427 family)